MDGCSLKISRIHRPSHTCWNLVYAVVICPEFMYLWATLLFLPQKSECPGGQYCCLAWSSSKGPRDRGTVTVHEKGHCHRLPQPVAGVEPEQLGPAQLNCDSGRRWQHLALGWPSWGAAFLGKRNFWAPCCSSEGVVERWAVGLEPSFILHLWESTCTHSLPRAALSVEGHPAWLGTFRLPPAL